MRGETSLLLLVPAAGGMIVDMDGEEVTLLTPASKLYQGLLGKSRVWLMRWRINRSAICS